MSIWIPLAPERQYPEGIGTADDDHALFLSALLNFFHLFQLAPSLGFP